MRRSKSKSAESSIRSLLLIGSAQYPRKVPGSTVAGGLLHLSYLYSSFSQGQIFQAWSFSIYQREVMSALSLTWVILAFKEEMVIKVYFPMYPDVFHVCVNFCRFQRPSKEF